MKNQERTAKIMTQAKVVEAKQADYTFDVKGITQANAQEMQAIKTKAQTADTFMPPPTVKLPS